MVVKKKARDAVVSDRYRVIAKLGKDGWWVAHLPSLEGAVGQGRTEASARRNLASALRDILETYRMQRRRVPWRR